MGFLLLAVVTIAVEAASCSAPQAEVAGGRRELRPIWRCSLELFRAEAVIGSTRAARRPRSDAARATARTTPAAEPYANGSAAVRPKRIDSMKRLMATAALRRARDRDPRARARRRGPFARHPPAARPAPCAGRSRPCGAAPDTTSGRRGRRTPATVSPPQRSRRAARTALPALATEIRRLARPPVSRATRENVAAPTPGSARGWRVPCAAVVSGARRPMMRTHQYQGCARFAARSG